MFYSSIYGNQCDIYYIYYKLRNDNSLQALVNKTNPDLWHQRMFQLIPRKCGLRHLRSELSPGYSRMIFNVNQTKKKLITYSHEFSFISTNAIVTQPDPNLARRLYQAK